MHDFHSAMTNSAAASIVLTRKIIFLITLCTPINLTRVDCMLLDIVCNLKLQMRDRVVRCVLSMPVCVQEWIVQAPETNVN